jgi:hypothetical protein
MRVLLWFVIIAVLAGMGWALARWRRQWAERQRIAEERLASFVAQAKPSAPTVAAAVPPAAAAVQPRIAPQERLLLDAAAKAGEAGEPVLAIQLYAKLLSRYPQTQFAGQARAAVEAQKKKLAHA